MTNSPEQNKIREIFSPVQFAMVFGKSRRAALVAAKGAGKTKMIGRIIRERYKAEPDVFGLVTWSSREQALSVFNHPTDGIKKYLESLGWHIRLKHDEMVCFINGKRSFAIRTAEQDIENLETVEYGWWVGDELSAYSFDHIKVFLSRVRIASASRLIRLFSMPADPQAPMYHWFEDLDFDLYEIPLTDNPNKEFTDDYLQTQRGNYKGAEFERYVEGKRVSITSEGRVFAGYGAQNNASCKYAAGYPLIVSMDFNKRPMTAIIGQLLPKSISGVDESNGYKYADYILCQVGEVILFPRHDRDVLYEDIGDGVYDLFWHHKGQVFVTGDCNGYVTGIGTEIAAYQKIIPRLKFVGGVQLVAPGKNPDVIGSTNTVNSFFMSADGVISLVVNPDLCPFSHRSYLNTRKLPRSDNTWAIDKKSDINCKTINDFASHPVDTMRYMAVLIEKLLTDDAHKQPASKIIGHSQSKSNF